METFYEYLRAWSHGTNQHALNCSLIREFRIWLPSIDRQREIAAELHETDSALRILARRLDQSKEYLVRLRESVLSWTER
jgi:restriction endonuclease S subunit